MPALKDLTASPFVALEESTVTTISDALTPAPNPARVPTLKGVWTTVPRGNDEALEEFAVAAGTNYLSIKTVLDGESILSKTIQLLDVTPTLSVYIDDEAPMFIGHVQKEVNEGRSRSIRGFAFNDGPQHVILAKFSMRTKLETPDEFGVDYGTREVIYAIFPDTTPGIRTRSGRITGQGYRPGFRLMVTNYSDDVKQPLWARFIQQAQLIHPNGTEKAGFSRDVLPKFLYGAARRLGATPEELCLLHATRQEERENKLLEGTGRATYQDPTVSTSVSTYD